MSTISAEIERRLAALQPLHLDVRNDSDRHRGHAGHDGTGESHFTVSIISEAFVGKSRVQRQRAVYAALGDLMESIHALAIAAAAPGDPLPER
ncbi:BolA family protein [Sphingosinicella soli]|uniref:BolA protein n=1 Tax=Sphingosinicella soli TaxID=333708 RepID=A0A7W7F5Y3_9SPHN|nr:BolA family protein [Sphingosinicella soli]MBB4631940.1 BolA protein [Sphingosinicella soli]